MEGLLFDVIWSGDDQEYTTSTATFKMKAVFEFLESFFCRRTRTYRPSYALDAVNTACGLGHQLVVMSTLKVADPMPSLCSLR
jgi:hypothetical protein